MEASALVSMMALPRESHLTQLYHMFFSLKVNIKQLCFYPTSHDIDESVFIDEDWTSTVYGDYKEDTPSNAPKSG